MTSRVLLPPLAQRLVPIRNGIIRASLQLVIGVALLALLAQVRIEIGPVPITGQTLGVLLIGSTYGTWLGGLTLTAYLLAGGLGLGVFAGGAAGWSVLTGATAGYLFGFVAAAAVVGYLAQRGWDRHYRRTALAMLIGNIIIYLPGLWWLSRFAPDGATTLQWGLTPFIPGDLIKLLLAVALLPTAWRLLGRQSGSSGVDG